MNTEKESPWITALFIASLAFIAGCLPKEHSIDVRTTPPYWYNKLDTRIEFPTVRPVEQGFEDSLLRSRQALAAVLWHYADTFREGESRTVIQYTTRMDLLETKLPGDAVGLKAAKEIARRIFRLLERRLGEEYYDQLYISFCKAPSIDSFRSFVFSRYTPTKAYERAAIYARNISSDTAQAYLTTLLLGTRIDTPVTVARSQSLPQPPR